MALGPVELLVVKFPGNEFKGEIAPALRELVESGTIRVIDILLINKDQEGAVTVAEIHDLDDEDYVTFDPVVEDLTALLTEDDARQLAGALETNSSAGVMLFENTWATRFSDAMANASGVVVLSERIPRAVIEELTTAQAQV